jgi:hypothetical protein
MTTSASRKHYVYFWFDEDWRVYYIGQGQYGRAWRKHGERIPYPPTIHHIEIIKSGLLKSEADEFEKQQIQLAKAAGIKLHNYIFNRDEHGTYTAYKVRKCRCEVCVAAFRKQQSGYRSRYVAEVRAGTREVKTHGVTGYRNGCRCDVCKEGWRKSSAEDKRRLVAKVRSGERTVKTHGISGYRHGCRCEECRAADSAQRQRYRLKQKAKDPDAFRSRDAEYARRYRTRPEWRARYQERYAAQKAKREAIKETTAV